MQWEAGKEYRTRCGLRARIYATDGGVDYPLHGAVDRGGRWDLWAWAADGSAGVTGESDLDLMPPRPLVEVSDAVVDAYLDAAIGPPKMVEHRALAAAISAYLAEREAD